MDFFERPILNSPYEEPLRHWELVDGLPTDRIIERRRKADLIAPLPKARSSGGRDQGSLDLKQEGLHEGAGDDYEVTALINDIRDEVARWRALPNPAQWQVTPATARLLQHWRQHEFKGVRPFFCQLEAVETAIWLAEVAPKSGKRGRRFLEHLKRANADANPELLRISLKLATGTGKTAVMAMLIAWQAVNAARSPGSKHFTHGFLVVAPGITIRDRLRVLRPNDPGNYYDRRELVPTDMLPEVRRAKVVIVNYHAFLRRERMPLSRGTRQAIEGHAHPVETRETDGQMVQRALGDLMGMRNIVVINDEAHHCYRAKPGSTDIDSLKGDEKAEAKENEEAARVWISGLEAVKRQIGLGAVYDLSATPFFLAGSGYDEGTLFPWTVSDFSLMDAIESGIVKLPRVPVADSQPGKGPVLYRKLWDRIGKKMPKKKGSSKKPNPADLPVELQTALDALYGHYQKTFDAWRKAGVGVPPVFIVVCNNTVNSQLLYEYISGYEREDQAGHTQFTPGRFNLFHNYDLDGNRLQRPNTLLIDSAQLEAGAGIDPKFRDAFADEIELFRREKAQREGAEAARDVTDEEILREAMNTVGREGRLGEQIRCVVSVSMLTEGWDANTVTHIMGLRAFGTKLICEQVIGRGLRRLSYDQDPETGLFATEYADIMGIDGLNFASQAVPAKPVAPRPVAHVHAVSPERDHLEIRFPRVEGYRTALPDERIEADFSNIEPFVLTDEMVGPCKVQMQGIVGMPETLDVEHLEAMRQSEIAYHLTANIIARYRDADGQPKTHLFMAMKRIVMQWLKGGHLICKGGTNPAQLCYRQIGEDVIDIILGAVRTVDGEAPRTEAILDPYNPEGSTAEVNFTTTVPTLWTPDARRCHLNRLVLHSGWEGELCRVLDEHPAVQAYVKNHNMGFTVPYRREGERRDYVPDFLVRLADGGEHPLNLVVEVKGERRHDARLKADAMRRQWVPAVNALARFGRWDFVEVTDPYEMQTAIDRVAGPSSELIE